MAGFLQQALARVDRSRVGLALAVCVAMLWGFWSAPLVDVDEGAFAEATREMIASGNYVSIHLNGEPRTDKPVLTYWAQAASVHLFGLNEAALRLPSVLAGLGWLSLLYRFTRRHTDRPTATVAALLMALSLYIGLIGKAATADALLNLFLAGTMFAIYDQFTAPRPARLRWIFVLMGLGFLTKGPVAVLIPLLVSGIFYLSYRRGREWLRLAFDPVGLLLFLAIVVPWHVAVYLDSGWTFFEGFYLHHNLDRYDTPMQGHAGGILYYPLVAPLIVMPFAGWLLSILGRLRGAAGDPLERYLWLWFFCVLAVFSLSGTKLPHYLLYGMSGLFVLMARHRESVRNRWLNLLPVAILFGLFGGLPQIFGALATGTHRAYDRELFESGAQAFAGWPQAGLIAAGIAVVLILATRAALWRRLLLVGYVQAAAIALIVAPTVIGVLQSGPKAAAEYAREHAKPLVFHRAQPPSVSLYRQAVIPRRAAAPGDWVYLRSDRVDEFLAEPSPYRRRVVFHQGPATLVAVEHSTGGD